jgi:hypothetical protein
MVFQLYITQTGTIAGVQQMQGPKIPEVERQLANTAVLLRFISEPCVKAFRTVR